LGDPDLAILLVEAARVVADRLGAAVERAGIDDMRAPFGFVIRALADRPCTLTELANVLDVSKQSAIKVVDEMEQRGLVRREPAPGDRRAKLISLTGKAERVRRTALAESHRLERELRRAFGAAEVATMRAVLQGLLERHGAMADAAAGRSRAAW
jgi:DNA-binding MarR family transcriptional regulator